MNSEICEYRDAVIMSMIDACRETIHSTKPANKCKTVPGWNDYVKGYSETSLLWQNMWVFIFREIDVLIWSIFSTDIKKMLIKIISNCRCIHCNITMFSNMHFTCLCSILSQILSKSEYLLRC